MLPFDCLGAGSSLHVQQMSSGLDWGNVPQWVSGVLAGVSTTLALYIILRDKRKTAREQAAKIGVVAAATRNDNLARMIGLPVRRVEIHNASDAPIFDVFVVSAYRRRRRPRSKLRARKRVLELGDMLNELMNIIGTDEESPYASAGFGADVSRGWHLYIVLTALDDVRSVEYNDLITQELTEKARTSYDLFNYRMADSCKRRVYVQFTDAHGTQWRIDVLSGKLRNR